MPLWATVAGGLGLFFFVGVGLIVILTCRRSRELPKAMQQRLAAVASHRRNQHRVTVTMQDGRRVEGVYIAYGRWVAYSFGLRPKICVREIIDVEQGSTRARPQMSGSSGPDTHPGEATAP